MTACPFPGLRPFQEKDAPFFFGRDREIAELLTRIRHQRFLAVIGVSGCGKSSLVHAGLIPELRIHNWRIVEIKAGTAAAAQLATGLTVELPGPDWSELLVGSSYGLSDGIKIALGQSPDPGAKLLIIVDQFEEIFEYWEKNAEGADLFVQQILRAASSPEVPAYILPTMRTDFLGRCAIFRNLPEALNDGSYLVPRLTRRQQEEVIRSPLTVFGVGIAPAVVDELLNACEKNRDELPVLQHLLKRLWEESGGVGPVTEEHLTKTGGWDKAVSLDADRVFKRLNQSERNAVRLVFQRITKKGSGNRPVRTPCGVTELAAICRELVTQEHLLVVMSEFRKCDFLVWQIEERIDIPHECLTWRWETLAGWIEEEDRDRQLLEFIQASMRGNLPLAGFKLDEGLGVRSRLAGPEWAARYGMDAEQLGRWIDFSAGQQRDQAAAEKRRAEDEKEATRKLAAARNSRHRILQCASGLLLSATVLAGWFAYQSVISERRALDAEATTGQQIANLTYLLLKAKADAANANAMLSQKQYESSTSDNDKGKFADQREQQEELARLLYRKAEIAKKDTDSVAIPIIARLLNEVDSLELELQRRDTSKLEAQVLTLNIENRDTVRLLNLIAVVLAGWGVYRFAKRNRNGRKPGSSEQPSPASIAQQKRRPCADKVKRASPSRSGGRLRT